MSNVAKQTALITGASSGLGKELARLYAKDGYDLVLVARSHDKLEALAKELTEAHGTKATVLTSDLSKAEAPSLLVKELERRNLQIDALINNAGYGLYGPFVETDLQKELEMIQLNVTSLTELSKHLLPGMVARGKGQILNVASTAAFQPGPLMAVYYATKAFVLFLSEALASELEGTGVTVTAFCPGPTESGFQAEAQLGSSKLVRGKKLPDAQSVAALGYKAAKKGKRVYIPGALNYAMANSVRFLPRDAATAIVKMAQAPSS